MNLNVATLSEGELWNIAHFSPCPIARMTAVDELQARQRLVRR